MANAQTIGRLNVVLGLDSAQYSEGLKTARTELAAFAKAGALTGAAIAGALTAAAVALGVVVRGVIDNADELSKTAQKVGVSVEALSKLKYAADLSDVSLDGLATGLKKLGVNMSDVADGGTGKAEGAFKKLGISVTDASGKLKTSDAVLAEVAGKFGPMADGAGKTAIAVALFGKAGSDLIPLLNSGAAGLKQMTDEASALGVVIDTKTAKSAEAFNDNLTRLHAVVGGISTQLTAAMLPALEGISTALVGAAKNGAALTVVGRTLGGALQVLASVAVGVGAAVAEVGFAFFGTFGAALKLMQGDVAGAQKALKFGGDGMVKTFTGSAQLIKDVWTKTGAGVLAAAPGLSDQIAAPITHAAPKIKAAGDKVAKEAERAAEKLRNAAQGIVKGLLSDDEAYTQKFAEEMRTLQEARDQDVAHYAEYTQAIERLQAQREGRGIKAKKFDATIGDLKTAEEELTPFSRAMARAGTEAERLATAFYYVGDAVGDAFGALKRGDWFGATQQILTAANALKEAFSSKGTTADRVGAVAGVAQGVGNAVGGTFGHALAGAAGGAAAGFSVGGPVGAAVGAVIGGISSLLGSSKAKKAKKKAEAQAAADKAAAAAAAEKQRLEDIATQKRQLEIQILRAEGKELEATAAERADALKAAEASDPAIAAAMRKLYDLADAAKAAGDAAAVAAERHALEIAALRASGDEAGAAALEQADYLNGLNAANRALAEGIITAQKYADAKKAADEEVAAASDALSEARDREASQLQATIDKFGGLRDSLRSFADSLNDNSPASAEQPGAAAAAFRQIASRIQGGDTSALGDVQQVSERFLASSQASARTLTDLLRDRRQAQATAAAAADLAGAQVDAATQQLELLNTQVDALLGIKIGVLSVRDAIANLAGALADQAAAQIGATAQAVQLAILAVAPPANTNAAVNVGGFSATDPAVTGITPAALADAAAANDDSIAAQVAATLATQGITLDKIASAVSASASISKQWNYNGMPDVREA